jgi:short-subunit dehydrogenase
MRKLDIHGRSILLTGASSGIGHALALGLAREGARLALAARGRDALDRVAAECRALGAPVICVPTDVTQPDACRAAVEATVAAFGGIDVLVNNAGISMWARFEEITDLTLFERIMRVNYLGAVYCTYHALPHLKQRRGLLVAVSSLTGKTGVPTRSAYAASKHAMQGFFDTLRIELAESGVDVLIVSPGFVKTGVRERALGADGQPIGRSPRDEERDTMSAERCAEDILHAMRQRQRELVMTAKARVGLWLRLVAPGVVDRIALRAVAEKRDR